MSHTKPTSPDVEDRKLKDLVYCSCSYNETYDGKIYNLKTEEYEDCECVERIPKLLSWKNEQVREALEEVLFEAREYSLTDIEMIQHQTQGKVDFIEAVTTDNIIKRLSELATPNLTKKEK